jgi:DNA-binding NarL/FixJ family response regulator
MKIIIADDHVLFRDGLKMMLEIEPDFEVTAEVENADNLMSVIQKQSADLIILDYSMPGGGSISALEYIKKRYPETKVISLTGLNSPDLFKQMLGAGADGIFMKDMSAQNMILSIKKVLAGEQVFSIKVKEALDFNQPKLTNREFQVMDLIVAGYSTNEIAAKLSLSAKTIENHRYNLMQKLELKNSVELTRYAQKQGLLSNF